MVDTMEKTTVYLSKDALARLELLARRRGQSKDELIQQAVDNLLACDEDEERPLPSWIGMVESTHDDGYDSSNYEEWLRLNWHAK